jgi:hypothetical protein
MILSITCPSGLAGDVRGLKGREANLLTDRTAWRRGRVFDEILAGCWIATTDWGLYDTSDRLDWSKVLVADRFYALLQIRRATFGDEYAFRLQCTNDACREAFEWSLRLSELPVRALSEESKAIVRSGNRFETTLPVDGRKVWFRLQTGADSARASARLQEQATQGRRGGALLTALASRIREIEGVAARDLPRFLEDLDLADHAALLARLDEVDGGVETDIDVECPHCLALQRVRLPFGMEFWMGKATRR